MVQFLSQEVVRQVIERTGPVPEGYVAKYYEDPVTGPSMRVSLALEMREIGQELSDLDRFYNRYYWSCKFCKAFAERFGFDAGVEQQNDEILEKARVDFDWAVVEELHNLAQSESV